MKNVLRIALLFIAGVLSLTAQELFLTIKVDNTNAGTDSPGKGTGYAVLSNDLKSLRYRVTVNNLNGTITASHFHYAPTTGVVHEVVFSGKTATGIWSNIPDSLIDAIFRNNLYLNIHTTTNAGGEVRGEFNIQQFGFPIDINGVNAGTSSPGLGTGYAYFGKMSDTGSISEIRYRATYAGLSGTRSAAHFHELPGGSVVHSIAFADSTADGTWTGFSDANLLKFYKRQMYLNIHSSVNAGGEVRGNLSVVGELGFAGMADGAQASTASNGKGTVWLLLHPDMTAKYAATFANLTGDFSAAHFHTSANGGVIKSLTFVSNHTTGNWTGMSDENIQDLLRGRVYMNVHSSTNAGGEIRANMEFSDGLFTGILDGSQASTSSTAKGTAWINLSDDSARYHATIAGLNGIFSAAHFHTTIGGGVIKAVTFIDSTTTGYWDMQEKIIDLVRGRIYLNVHSSVNAGGEIRADMKAGSGTPTSVQRISEFSPANLALGQNYPNPFNPATTITFQVPAAMQVMLKVYDVIGKEIATVMNEQKQAGSYSVRFDASNLAGGMYFYRLSAGTMVQTKKMILLK
jgi:hypothetical protein